jgi:hypothetical protein
MCVTVLQHVTHQMTAFEQRACWRHRAAMNAGVPAQHACVIILEVVLTLLPRLWGLWHGAMSMQRQLGKRNGAQWHS